MKRQLKSGFFFSFAPLSSWETVKFFKKRVLSAMEITRRKKRAPKAVVGELAELYPHDVQLYKLPPLFVIVKSEFDNLTVERLKCKNFFQDGLL